MATKKKKDELTEEILPEGGLVDELVEEMGDKVEEPEIESADDKVIDSVLSTYLGDELLENLRNVANILDFKEIDDADNVLVFGGRTQSDIKFGQFREGENFLTPSRDFNAKFPMRSIERNSISKAVEFSDDKFLSTLTKKINNRARSGPEHDARRAEQAQRLKNIGRVASSLASVFGFDDPRQAEAFLAAWLMKDSTCRLSGIPGTGKTTVVESAGLLLANSYGFDTESRFIPQDPDDKDSGFFMFEKGQEYEAYLNNNALGIREAWDEWRFTEWYVEDEGSGDKTDRSLLDPEDKNFTGVSGSYLFDATFLQKKYKLPIPTTDQLMAHKLGSMKPELFRKALLNVWIHKKKIPSTLDDAEHYEYRILPIQLGPELFANGDGRIEAGDPHPTLPLDANGEGYTALWTVNYHRILSTGITVPDGSTLAEEITKEGLSTDAGRNEGYDLREWLMSHYFDSRIKNKSGAGWTEIKGEMLREIGTAKIDYDKRADEVLYGMDIRNVARPDPIDAKKTISTYEFEPIPRPVVTQPVKFFNEANRSQSGVEDAILGLIAEKEVEYRGRSFRSPNFVAWMDTNPHQKGNDLAFVDRIDMELLFSTVTLGQRLIQLNAQYNPQTIATDGVEKLAISQPQDRIIFDDEIGIASDGLRRAKTLRVSDLKNLWKEIDNIPFNSEGKGGGDLTNYDGLRDISLLSVMFTQRFMSKPLSDQVKVENRQMALPDSRQIHSSPLIDISKASNKSLTGGEAAAIEGFRRNATAFGDPDGPESQAQTPTLFKRVLGYRVTKSLVKLSRAFAFLRGKDFVTRQEILDALPYVVGHRMGPARAGEAKDDVGYIEGALGSMTSEQEMIRELIVGGYIKSSTTEGEPNTEAVWDVMANTEANPNEKDRKNTLLDVWDAYYQRCVSILKSSGTFAEYEERVINPIKIAINGTIQEGADPDNSRRTTPIHWHIAAMVVEVEKKSAGGDCLRKDDGMTYAARYDTYFKAMNAPGIVNPLAPNVPSTDEAIQLDYSLYDYYYLRGKIANDPLLFTDDKTYLLGLVESRIQAFVGSSFNLDPEETSQVTYALSSSSTWNDDSELVNNYIVNPNPGVALNSTYGDAVGAYGQLFGKLEGDFDITSLIPNEDYDTLFDVDENTEVSYQLSNQKMKISGSYHHGKDRSDSFIPVSSATARSPGTYLSMTDAVTDSFYDHTGEGVVINGIDKKITEDNLDFSVTMEDIESALEAVLENPSMEPTAAIQNAIPSPWMQDVFTPEGAFFCFELDHHPTSEGADSLLRLMKSKDPPLIDMDATTIPRDKLRLWMWMAANITEDEEGFTKTVSLVATYGITSSFLENTILLGNTIDLPGAFISIDNEDYYGSGDLMETLYLDSGNITEADVNAYNQLFREAVRRSTQGS